PFAETSPKLVLADLGGIGASEIVAGFARGARIVKAFNSIRMAHFNEGPIRGQDKRLIFISGAEAESKRAVKDLIESFDFAAIDLGGLVTGGRIQQAGGSLAGLDLFLRPDAAPTGPNACSKGLGAGLSHRKDRIDESAHNRAVWNKASDHPGRH